MCLCACLCCVGACVCVRARGGACVRVRHTVFRLCNKALSEYFTDKEHNFIRDFFFMQYINTCKQKVLYIRTCVFVRVCSFISTYINNYFKTNYFIKKKELDVAKKTSKIV